MKNAFRFPQNKYTEVGHFASPFTVIFESVTLPPRTQGNLVSILIWSMAIQHHEC